MILRILLCIVLGIIAFLFAFFFVFLLVLCISYLLVSPKRFYQKNSKYYRFLLNFSTWIAIVFGRIHIHTTGLEKIPEGTRFVLVGNHQSKFDPILSWYILRKKDIAFISKPENFKQPIFGRIIRKCCFLSIDRGNPKKAMETIKVASDLIKNDEVSIGVYPEGTRGNGDKLLPFHNGVFYVAKNAKCPIVVLAVRNTRNIAKNFPLRRTDVYFDVTDVLDVEYVSKNKTSVIGERVKEALLLTEQADKTI